MAKTAPEVAVQAPVTPGPLQWVKSSRSIGHGECVELAADGGTILVRDSKDPDGARLRFTKRELAAFLLAAGDGEFDHLID